MLAEKYDADSGKATLQQDELVKRILARLVPEVTRDDIFRNHWLDIEPFYQHAWVVTYNKPAYYQFWSTHSFCL